MGQSSCCNARMHPQQQSMITAFGQRQRISSQSPAVDIQQQPQSRTQNPEETPIESLMREQTLKVMQQILARLKLNPNPTLVLCKIESKDLAVFLSDLNQLLDAIYERAKKIYVPLHFYPQSEGNILVLFRPLEAVERAFPELGAYLGADPKAFLRQKNQQFVAREYVFQTADSKAKEIETVLNASQPPEVLIDCFSASENSVHLVFFRSGTAPSRYAISAVETSDSKQLQLSINEHVSFKKQVPISSINIDESLFMIFQDSNIMKRYNTVACSDELNDLFREG